MFNFFKPKPKVTVSMVLHPELTIRTEMNNFSLVKAQMHMKPEDRYWADFDNDGEYIHPYYVTGLKLVKGKVTEIEFTKTYTEL